MLRATARMAFGDGWRSVSVIGMLWIIPLLTFMRPLEGERPVLLFGAIGMLLVAFLGAHLRGRATGPGGLAGLETPMPMLPVSRWVRMASVVIVGEGLLLTAAILGAAIAAFAEWRDADLGGRPPPPLPWAELPVDVLTAGLAFAPLLAVGSEGGAGIRGGRALLYGLGLLGLAAIGVDHSLPLAAIWCVVGLLVLPRIPTGERSEGMEGYPVVGQGLPGVLASHVLLTLPLALGMGVIGVGIALLGIAGWAELLAWTTVVTAAMLPVLPASHEAGALQPSGVGTLALLPVSRNRVVAMIFAASFVRIATVAAVAAGITLLTGNPLGDGPLGHPIALLATTMCLTAALQLAGLRHRPLLALGGILLGMVALSGGFDARTDFPAWFSLGMPTLAAIYAVAIAVRTSRRGVWA